MKIKLTDHFRGKKPGEVIDWPDPMAKILIDSGRAVQYEDGPADKAIDAAPVDKMQRKPKAVKHGG